MALARIIIMLTRVFAEAGIALPVAVKFLRLNLIDTDIGLALAHALRVIPISTWMGGISVAAIFSWLFSWDEFIYALYLCLAEPTLPLKVDYYINRGNWFLTATYAAIITILAPNVIVIPPPF